MRYRQSLRHGRGQHEGRALKAFGRKRWHREDNEEWLEFEVDIKPGLLTGVVRAAFYGGATAALLILDKAEDPEATLALAGRGTMMPDSIGFHALRAAFHRAA